MYNVQTMAKRYTVAHVRERLSDALDEAERGEAVLIERRGVTYELRRAPVPAPRARRRKPMMEILDPAVAEGQWTWEWSPGRLRFKDTRTKR